jgi:replicative DNA helicase
MPASPKIPPHSDEAEVSILGAMLIDKDAVVNIAEFLKPVHFYQNSHSQIFEVMLGLYEHRQPIDLLTVSEGLKKKKLLTAIGGSAYLASLAESVPTASHITEYGKIVKDLAIKRQLISSASKLSQMAFDEGVETKDLLDQAEQEVFGLSQRHLTRSFVAVKDALAESFDRLDELHKKAGSLRGVPSGFPSLDNCLAGMQSSNLLVLAARPGIGKTSLALNISRHVAVEQQIPIGIFSLEMSQEELVDRLLVAQADIDAWKLKTGKLDEDDFGKLADAMGILAEAPLYIDDTPGLSILEMRTKARRLQVDRGIKALIVDYLQLIRGHHRYESRVQEVSEISQGLKNLARELKIPILSLSQLSRAVEHRGTKKPQLADLRESGAIEQDADVVMFLWREDEEDLSNINLSIDKHRNGPLALLKLFFRGDRISFFEAEGKREAK